MASYFGSLGGLGASFPMRNGTPNSQRVQSLDEITNDIWAQYDADRKAQDTADDTLTAALDDRWADIPNMTAMQQAKMRNGISTITSRQASMGNASPAMMALSQDPNQLDNASKYMTAYGVELNREPYQQAENAATEAFNQRETRGQQAYDSMRGWGQENGVMGANYSAPGFGQVNGIAGNPYAVDTEAAKGADMSWTDGAFNPQNGNAGVYSPAAPRKNTGWGLW